MTTGQDPESVDSNRDTRGSSDRPATEAERSRRRRLAAVFGDVLPEQTGDDRDQRSPGESGGDQEAWLRDQVPPHHG